MKHLFRVNTTRRVVYCTTLAKAERLARRAGPTASIWERAHGRWERVWAAHFVKADELRLDDSYNVRFAYNGLTEVFFGS